MRAEEPGKVSSTTLEARQLVKRTQTLGIAPRHDLVAVADAELERSHAHHFALGQTVDNPRQVDRVVKIAAYLPRRERDTLVRPA